MVDDTILWLDACQSTNDEAAKYIRNRQYTTVVAHYQTRGRGRLGRTWHSPAGCGLYLSHIVFPKCSQQIGGAIPLLAGVAVAETCEALGVNVELKWPNDVLVGDKKLAGILCEAQGLPSQWNAIIGIGLNLKTPSSGWPEDVPGVALDALCDAPVDPRSVARTLIRRLDDRIRALENEGTASIFDAWMTRGLALGTRIRRGELEGQFAGLTSEGALRIQTTHGMETVHAGDVHVVRGE